MVLVGGSYGRGLVVSTSDATHTRSAGACAYCVPVIFALSIMARWKAGVWSNAWSSVVSTEYAPLTIETTYLVHFA